MKLAEALIERADHQSRPEQLRQRVLQNVRVQEGDKPAEQPSDLLQEIERVAARLEWLIQLGERPSTTPRGGPRTVYSASPALLQGRRAQGIVTTSVLICTGDEGG